MLKIAFIGAGRVVFARNLMGDILPFPELRESTISLMDIDPERLELITQLTPKLIAQEKFSTVIQSTQDQREALEGETM